MRNYLATKIIIRKRPKIWGKKINLFDREKIDIDVLFLKRNTFCSRHYHEAKSNTFILLSGCVYINTWINGSVEEKELKCFVPFTVDAEILHRFVVQKDAVMVEINAVKHGIVEEDDIIRISQGGRIVNGRELSENYLRITGEL